MGSWRLSVVMEIERRHGRVVLSVLASRERIARNGLAIFLACASKSGYYQI
jgi:hypothetical protein